ncbi:MAG TPA: glycosyl hydrolase family 79 C-terminal domain-containing protein [Acidobacteriaceae bacterium]|nr:glycosyl hydrolase family 79 C-terminal domain-containing protein [Acidobacteriaceae bacterium]
MDRRTFLRSTVLASGAAVCGNLVFADAASSVSLRLTLDPHTRGNPVPADFTGLSYESAQLSEPEFFSASNTELVGFVRRLGASGVLRIGGNTSEWCYWTPDASTHNPATDQQQEGAVLEQAIGPDKGHKLGTPRKITPEAVRNLRGFIDATGWKLIYGLNMGSEAAETAAAEADYVMRTMGDKLIAFQLCNEPDLFYRNGLRKSDYNFAQFAQEWQHFYEVIRQKVPHAPFAGPDTAFNNEWLAPFAKQFKDEAAFLSQHYYAEGPPENPAMTITRLLNPSKQLEAEFQGMAQTKADSGLPFRLAETNSCYQGGKRGVSDTFASALWGADLMYQLATAGGVGINFHGGGYGWYTPIAGTIPSGFTARPIYYGMLLFAQAGPGHLIDAKVDNQQDAPLVNAYGLVNDGAEPRGTVKAVVFNKHDDRDVKLTIDGGERANRARALRLSAPRLDDTQDVTLGGNPVGASGAWSAEREEDLAVHDGVAAVDLPPGSAALVTLHFGNYK